MRPAASRKTASVSPGVSAGELLFSLVALTSVYLALLIVEVKLLVKYTRGGVASAMPELGHPDSHSDDADDSDGTNSTTGTKKQGDDVLSFAY